MNQLEETLKIIEHEPNREEFEYQGYKCLIRRNMSNGSLCGYVMIPEGHNFYEKGIDDDLLCTINVHGGITWANFFPEENNKIWYIGFDCCHYHDFMPFMAAHIPSFFDHEATYKDWEYVKKEIKNMVHQMNKEIKR